MTNVPYRVVHQVGPRRPRGTLGAWTSRPAAAREHAPGGTFEVLACAPTASRPRSARPSERSGRSRAWWCSSDVAPSAAF